MLGFNTVLVVAIRLALARTTLLLGRPSFPFRLRLADGTDFPNIVGGIDRLLFSHAAAMATRAASQPVWAAALPNLFLFHSMLSDTFAAYVDGSSSLVLSTLLDRYLQTDPYHACALTRTGMGRCPMPTLPCAGVSLHRLCPRHPTLSRHFFLL